MVFAAPIAIHPNGPSDTAVIRQMRLEADGIVSLDLQPDGPLQPWTAGAHLDLVLPSGRLRQYSLCNTPDDGFYRIAVLRLGQGRGGSREVHDDLRVGLRVQISALRNAFALEPASRYLFVAGGIGITPILPMVRAAQENRADWTLIYGGRQRNSMAFLGELSTLPAQRIAVQSDDKEGSIDVASLVANAQGAHVYACGPQGLLDALEIAFETAGRAQELHLERFAASAKPLPGDGTIRVFLARQGEHVDVPPDQSILLALRNAGHELDCSCEQGFCGTCETRVLSGVPDHRDQLLTESERARGDVIFPCVSRAKTDELVLDI